MSRVPDDFSSEDELVEWFETSDLSKYDLEDALEVAVAPHVALLLDDPWHTAGEARSSGAATGEVTLSSDLAITR